MSKQKPFLIALIMVMLGLAACAGVNLPGTANAASGTNGAAGSAVQPAAQGTPRPGQGSEPIEFKLALGSLKLEGTDKAITAEQAKNLLPLWKAVKSLSASTTISQQEITALYQQIQDTMTPEQVQAIKTMQVTPEETQALMKQYNVTLPVFPTLSADQQATREARRQSSGAAAGGTTGQPRGNFAGGDFGGFPGGFPGGAGGFDRNGGAAGGTGTTAQRTPQPGQSGQPRAGFRGGMNTLWVDPLIKVLEQRAG